MIKATVNVKGKDRLDAETKRDCLQALADNATTEELKKLKVAISRPDLRGYLNMM